MEKEILLQRFDELCLQVGSANKAAKRIGVSPSAISQIKNGTYLGDTDSQLKKLAAYFAAKDEKSECFNELEYAPTSISNTIYETIRACQIKGGFAIATGDAGIGKTKAIRKYAADYPENTIVITVNPCCKHVKSLLKLLAGSTGVSTSQSVDDVWYSIAKKLHDGMIIIVDESQLLPYYSIETLRSFSDYFDSMGQTLGIVLVGNDGIREKIDGKSRETYRQINNRTWQRPHFKTADVKISDIEMLLPLLKNHSSELKFMHKIAQTGEGIRGAIRLFSNAYDNENYTIDGLAAMAKHMRINIAG